MNLLERPTELRDSCYSLGHLFTVKACVSGMGGLGGRDAQGKVLGEGTELPGLSEWATVPTSPRGPQPGSSPNPSCWVFI